MGPAEATNESNTDPFAEIEAMKVIASQLSALDDVTARRVLRWALERFAGKQPSTASPVSASPLRPQEQLDEGEMKTRFQSLADFYAACAPSQENDKALVAGYWVQVVEGAGEFDALNINRQLKNLGHGIANITSAFDSLQARRPQFVIQTRKSGTSRQARKQYKLTVEGIRTVERMINHEE
jgi:hypothetical protein